MNFIDSLKQSKNPRDECVRYALLWIAAVDAEVHEKEQAYVVENLGERPHELPIERIVEAVNLRNPAVDSFAFEVLRKLLTKEDRALVLELAVGVARADGRVAHSEVHALRFAADALEVSPREFAQIYRKESNAELPEPADLSDPTFWEQAERATRERAGQQGQESYSSYGGNWNWTPPQQKSTDAKTRDAFATLGLTDSATADDIKDAYRRLAAVHHPDRFSPLGRSATDTATKTFQRIKAAYDHLSSMGRP